MNDVADTTARRPVPAHVVDVAGLPTTYRRAGSGDPVLVLTGQGHPSQWLPFYDALAERFDVIVPEHPGFGETPLPDFIRDFNDLSVHYAGLLDALGVSPAHVIGHSFGAWVAAELAGLYPERIRSLTLVSPTGVLPDVEEPMPDWYRMSREQYLDRALGEERERWAAFTETAADPAEQLLADYQERTGVARVAWNPRYSLRLEHRLQRLQAPAQVIVPDEDRLTPASVARRYSELLSDAPVITVSGDDGPTQHLLVLQAPERIAERVAALTAAGL